MFRHRQPAAGWPRFHEQSGQASIMKGFPFTPSELGTLGVEMEWITVDARSGAQVPAAPALLERMEKTPRIKQELFTSTVEINTDIHRQSLECIDELTSLHHRISSQLRDLRAALLSSGTHPFSRWRDQQLSDDPRYRRLVQRLQWMARRFNIFGIHVHVGMPDGDTCIRAMNRLLPILPMFLGISANSPFWQGKDTGLSASRIKVFEGLSQGGMPFYFDDWRDFEHCAERLLATGSIDSIRDIWWEMRPHPDFGTLEVRVGDMPATRADTAAYVAYVHAEARIAATAQPASNRVHPSLIRENRWRACRYGLAAVMIDPETETSVPLLDWLERRLEQLYALGISEHQLEPVRRQLPIWRSEGGGDQRQRRLFAASKNFADMVRLMRETDGWSHA